MPAGHYRIEVENRGFKSVVMPGVTLHIQDVDEINFEMALGSMSETVTVNSDNVQMNTTDASVSTVVDQALISELPMNGRSLDTLFLLTPGVVPSGTQNAGGQYSVNGQRSSGNYLTVDGASGNLYLGTNVSGGPVGTAQTSIAGSTYATSASGGTNGLLPVDAIEDQRERLHNAIDSLFHIPIVRQRRPPHLSDAAAFESTPIHLDLFDHRQVFIQEVRAHPQSGFRLPATAKNRLPY